MLQSFLQHLKKEQLSNSIGNVLIAVSGGVDSVVMAELFQKAKLPFAIAHCNFQLRGKESEQDETFVETLAEQYGVPFHSVSFETTKYAKKNKLSIQEAARMLRYEWFEELRKQYKYTSIATAHHADDSTETFLINMIRGTGISGMHGILPKQGNIIRPLLFANKENILDFAKKNKLKFREDSSNASDKYLRNKIRLKVIPLLKTLNPDISGTFTKNIQYLRDAELIVKKEVEQKRKSICKTKGTELHISIAELQKLAALPLYLFEFLKPYGFPSGTTDLVIKTLEKGSGKQFHSTSHTLLIDRGNILIKARKSETKKENSIVSKSTKTIRLNEATVKFKTITASGNLVINRDQSTASLDLNKLKFPLTIRKWEQGDRFQPIGMKGQKKLSDYFIDKKLSIFEKEKVHVLLSGNKIAWVIGHRIADDFKISDKTKQIYFAELL